MATEQDVELASRRTRDAVERRDLTAAKAALEDLKQLVRTFESVRERAPEPELREQVEQWISTAQCELGDARSLVGQLELDMMDPAYEQRVSQREQEKAARENADKVEAAQLLQGLGGPFGALAGLAGLGAKARPASPAADEEQVACASCQTPNPRRAKFCMECGKPTARRCASCGAELGRAKFCPECGAKAS